MADNMVQADYQALYQASKDYTQLAQDLQQVYQKLGEAAELFMKAAMKGLVGAAIQKIVVEVMKMLIQRRIQKFQEVSGDLKQSVVCRMVGDISAVPNFRSGITL